MRPTEISEFFNLSLLIYFQKRVWRLDELCGHWQNCGPPRAFRFCLRPKGGTRREDWRSIFSAASTDYGCDCAASTHPYCPGRSVGNPALRAAANGNPANGINQRGRLATAHLVRSGTNTVHDCFLWQMLMLHSSPVAPTPRNSK